jgi:hypothetical protein
LKGEWRIKLGPNKPHLESPVQCWDAAQAPFVELEIACGSATTARIFWKRLDDEKVDVNKSLTLDLNPDGEFHHYRLSLASSLEYRGLLVGLAIEPVGEPRPREELAIKSILLRER